MNLIGQKVKLFLVNSLSAEGVVHSWSDSQTVLISNQRHLVINNPNSNIIMYYVFDMEPVCDIPAKQEKALDENIEPEFAGENITELNVSLKLKKIADLKIMAANAQREQVRKQLTTFHSINTDQILGKYGTPSFINPQYSSPQEVSDGNAVDSGVLPEMPGETTK